MKVLICGGRTFGFMRNVDNTKTVRDPKEFNLFEETMEQYKTKIKRIISGGAFGADALAEYYARKNSIPIEVYHANWEQYGKAAGAIRNTQMLLDGEPDLVIAFPGGKGTANMIKVAKAAGVETREIDYKRDSWQPRP